MVLYVLRFFGYFFSYQKQQTQAGLPPACQTFPLSSTLYRFWRIDSRGIDRHTHTQTHARTHTHIFIYFVYVCGVSFLWLLAKFMISIHALALFKGFLLCVPFLVTCALALVKLFISFKFVRQLNLHRKTKAGQ